MEVFSLRPQPLLAHWAPGAVLTVIALFYVADANGVRLFWRLASSLSVTLLIVLLTLISFAIGQVLDAFRDGIVEDLFDWVGGMLPNGKWFTKVLRWLGVKQVNWEFFVNADPKIGENFEVWFYSHYMLSFNLGFGLLVLTYLPWWKAFEAVQPRVTTWLPYTLGAAGVILLYDALRLRSWVAKISARHTGREQADRHVQPEN